MNGLTNGWLLPQEQALVEDCLRELTSGTGSLVIQPMAGIESEVFCDLLVGRLWDQGYWDSAFNKSWLDIEELSPPGVIGQALGLLGGQQIRGPQELGEYCGKGDKPIIIVFSMVAPKQGQKWSEYLSIWAKYLHGFKHLNEQGMGLRCLFCLGTDSPGLGRQNSVPEPFSFISWPEQDDSAIENFLLLSVQEYCGLLSSDVKQYTVYKIMDLAGNRKPDLFEMMRQVGELSIRKQPGEVDMLAWSAENPMVMQAAASIQAMNREKLMPFLKQLFSRGGFISTTDERVEANRVILDLMWEQGLYSPPWGDKAFGTLTPRALAALRWLGEDDTDFAVIKGIIARPWVDRAASEILDRCLQIERMLKQRAVQLVSNSIPLRNRLSAVMDTPSRNTNHKVNRQVLMESLSWQDPDEPLDDISLLEACTLGQFFFLFDNLGLQRHGSQHEHRRFVEIRNTLAHAHRSDWSIYKNFLDIEERLIGER